MSWINRLKANELECIIQALEFNVTENKIIKKNGSALYKSKINSAILREHCRRHERVAEFLQGLSQDKLGIENGLKEVGKETLSALENPFDKKPSKKEREITLNEYLEIIKGGKEEESDEEQDTTPIGDFDSLNFNKTSTPNNKNYTEEPKQIKITEMEEVLRQQKELIGKLDRNSVELRKFAGNEGEDVERFIKNAESCAVINEWSNEIKVKNIAKALIGKARDFLINEIQENGRKIAWEELKPKLCKEYGKTETMLNAELQRAKQKPEEGMKEFFDRIRELCRQVRRDMSEETICGYIVDGLKAEHRDRLNLFKNETLEELKENI